MDVRRVHRQHVLGLVAARRQPRERHHELAVHREARIHRVRHGQPRAHASSRVRSPGRLDGRGVARARANVRDLVHHIVAVRDHCGPLDGVSQFRRSVVGILSGGVRWKKHLISWYRRGSATS